MMTGFPWRTLDKIVALIGVTIVAVELYVLALPPLHVLLLALGAMLLYVGTWRLTGRLLHKRANLVLRGELDTFIRQVRKLYSDRSSGDSAAIHETKAELRATLDRIIGAANTVQENR
ncbi:MAG: hypothetical protein GWN99_05565 [Gemmatimonadetes bacterium]|uniref:Uncharacterized protein n=1 Tax=Candidatus Kutchimonas denitrificans TaxID=3056748 RepID=A0AAE5CCU7_9BACT|nr:hypothetical protein [Gemmatimonadota bacterium]NIR76155.1 hypothetical protein [Candidatus Kutchimonas denitrificans]NIS00534.1 hypothetical protein [Gemmatimonadota bacterium]NIT66192.1 hypothetical protein [Gemmatimonadota bacterium]NIU54270.1 hypothetical protein [Gemmatimonadota bacterium]